MATQRTAEYGVYSLEEDVSEDRVVACRLIAAAMNNRRVTNRDREKISDDSRDRSASVTFETSELEDGRRVLVVYIPKPGAGTDAFRQDVDKLSGKHFPGVYIESDKIAA